MNSRIFIAVNQPKKLKKLIFEELSLMIPDERMKKVEKENLHLSLKFLGCLDESFLEKVKEKLGKVKVEEKEFKASFGLVKDFKNKVLWLEVKSGATELKELEKEINSALSLKQENFIPHLTLARNKNLTNLELKELEEKINKKIKEIKLEEKEFVVKEFSLMESILKPSGPEYRKLNDYRISTE
ncbi:MAG: RNA 2',3'-cyclic phosphodiesterase [archaeon]